MAMLYMLFLQQCSTHTKIGRSKDQSMDKTELPTALMEKKKKRGEHALSRHFSHCGQM
jgi:hypothetical protein